VIVELGLESLSTLLLGLLAEDFNQTKPQNLNITMYRPRLFKRHNDFVSMKFLIFSYDRFSLITVHCGRKFTNREILGLELISFENVGSGDWVQTFRDLFKFSYILLTS